MYPVAHMSGSKSLAAYGMRANARRESRDESRLRFQYIGAYGEL